MNIYEINLQIAAVMDEAINKETGEVNENLMLELSRLKLDKQTKSLHIARKIKNLTAEIKALEEEEKSLYKRRKTKQDLMQHLKEYLNNTIAGEKYEDASSMIYWIRSTTTKINDASNIPKELCRHIPEEWIPVKTAIKEYLMQGNKIPGVELTEKQNVQIK